MADEGAVIAVLCGGVGAARMLEALRLVVAPEELCGIVNTADDLTLHGLRICPDLDTITYTLAGRNNVETGWGLTGETWRAMEALDQLGGESWFRLGDEDLATHLYRTERLRSGATLSQVTAELGSALGCDVALLPVTEDPLATRFDTLEHGELSFQDYFVRHRHSVPVRAINIDGASAARPAPGVLEALDAAERIVLSPSNPLISVAPILAVPGVHAALASRRSDVVAVSPLIGGRALKGPADRLLLELGHETSPGGIAALYRDVAGTLVIDVTDADETAAVEAQGVTCLVAETLMDGAERSRRLAEVILGA